MSHPTAIKTEGRAIPWNKGKLLGQKPPLKLKEIWAIRIRLQLTHRSRELALFNLAIDSKLRGCDLVGLHVYDPVIVTEGERKADKLAALGMLATTSGAADSADKADWQPLAGRTVRIWPDNDEAGQRYALAVTKILLGLGCTVRHVDVAVLGLPPKGDAVDWLVVHPEATADEVLALASVDAHQTIATATNTGIAHTPRFDGGGRMSLEVAAQVVCDAIERAKQGDCGAPFERPIVDALCVLREEDQAQFMRLRAAIKKANRDVKISELDALLRGDESTAAERQTADRLVDLARECCTLFHDPDREPHATFENAGHRECWHIYSKGFVEWLSYAFYREEGRAPAETAVRSALATLAGQAKFEGETKSVAVRVASQNDTIWIDLCDEAWQTVAVTPDGWRIVDAPPIMFTRSSSMRALPMPEPGGSLSVLWDVINIPEGERLMTLTWVFEAYRANTPYPVLELCGEQGSAKSSTQKFLRELIDPNQSNNRTAPKTVEDVFVTARNAHLVSYENLSYLAPQYQDALCVLATGSGYATRTFYTNADETVLNLKKPVALNGIAVVVTAQDLLDRTVHIDLPTVKARITEEELQRAFDEKKQKIFGGLLDLLVQVLSILPTIEIEPTRLPRMADFALLGEAVYRAHDKPSGAFLLDYSDKRTEGVRRTLEISPTAVAVLSYLDKHPEGFEGSQGTVKELFETLTPFRPEGDGWPRSPKGFADQLRRIAPSLRLIGINARISDKPGMHGYTCVLKREPKADVSRERGKLSSDVHEVHNVHSSPHEFHEPHEGASGVPGAENIYGPGRRRAPKDDEPKAGHSRDVEYF